MTAHKSTNREIKRGKSASELHIDQVIERVVVAMAATARRDNFDAWFPWDDVGRAALEAAGVPALLDVVEDVAPKWDNIHTHYGFTSDCQACNAIAMLTQAHSANPQCQEGDHNG